MYPTRFLMNFKKACNFDGYNMSIYVSTFYFIASLILYATNVNSRLILVAVPLIYFIVATLVFAALILEGRVLEPLTWFLLGSGIFFGLGTFAGGLQVHGYSKVLFGESVGHLAHISLLNSISVFTILIFGTAVLRMFRAKTYPAASGAEEFRISALISILRVLIFIAVANIILNFYFFPLANNLLLRSFLDKLVYIFPATFLVFGIVHKYSTVRIRLAVYLVGISAILDGLLLLNKYQILMPIIAFSIGFLVSKPSVKQLLVMAAIPILCFLMLNPLISMARLHHLHDPYKNDISQRIAILNDVFYSAFFDNTKKINPEGTARSDMDTKSKLNIDSRLRWALIRFDTTTVQGYLINEYDNGRKGVSLEQFWVALIPRVLWRDKPIITDVGNQLSVQLYSRPDMISSSTAPTYSAEAYWNGGYYLVIITSIYLGCLFGLCSHLAASQKFARNPAYLVVAFPMILSAVFLESWIVATYIGGVFTAIIFFLLFYVGYFAKQRKNADEKI